MYFHSHTNLVILLQREHHLGPTSRSVSRASVEGMLAAEPDNINWIPQSYFITRPPTKPISRQIGHIRVKALPTASKLLIQYRTVFTPIYYCACQIHLHSYHCDSIYSSLHTSSHLYIHVSIHSFTYPSINLYIHLSITPYPNLWLPETQARLISAFIFLILVSSSLFEKKPSLNAHSCANTHFSYVQMFAFVQLVHPCIFFEYIQPSSSLFLTLPERLCTTQPSCDNIINTYIRSLTKGSARQNTLHYYQLLRPIISQNWSP